MKKRNILLLTILTVCLFIIGCKSPEDIVTSGENKYVDIKKAQISKEQTYGADMVILDYASDDIIIFHGYFGLFIYSLNDSKIIDSIDLKSIDCNSTQGDNYCKVLVSNDGKAVQLHNISSKYMYVYSVDEKKLTKKEYKPLKDSFELITNPEVQNEQYYCSSSEAVKFKDGVIGYLVLNDTTINSLEYIRGNERFIIFEE